MRNFCAVALLTLMCRDIQQQDEMLVKVAGAMLTLAAAFGVLTSRVSDLPTT